MTRVRLVCCLIGFSLVAGLIAFLRGPVVREARLQRMDVAALAAWTARRPDDALGHYYSGMALERANRHEEAARSYATALDRDPSLTRACPPLATLLARNGREQAAEALLQEALQLHPGDAALHAGLARVYEARGDLRRAASSWERVTTLAPGDAEGWFRLGSCWMRLGNDVRAQLPFREAVARKPLSATYRLAFAGVLRLRGRHAEAERHCRRALFLRPDDPDAHFEMAKILRDRDGATPRAAESLRRAVSLRPGDPLLRYYHGIVLQEQGEAAAATVAFRSALLQLHGQKPSESAPWSTRSEWLSYLKGAHFNLATLLKRQGRSPEADRHLAAFRRLSDHHLRVSQLLTRIATRPQDTSLRSQLARLQGTRQRGESTNLH